MGKPWEETWTALVEERHGAPRCLGVERTSDSGGDPLEGRTIVETDSGVYPPSIEQARLIAAAPDLYRALDMLAACIEYCDYERMEREIGAARAALAKARGE